MHNCFFIFFLSPALPAPRYKKLFINTQSLAELSPGRYCLIDIPDRFCVSRSFQFRNRDKTRVSVIDRNK